MREAWRAALAVTVLIAVAAAQQDLRDTLVRRDGTTVRGRVATPFATDEVLVLQGSRRVRVPVADVATTDLVNDRLREWLRRRQALRANASAQWQLVEWAAAIGLPAMARLQAVALALGPDGGDPRAHSWLGNRNDKGVWRWRHEDRWLTHEELAAAARRAPLELTSEHFLLRLDGGIREAALALVDLETLYLWWFDGHGRELGLREAVQPVVVRTWSTPEEFPRWGSIPRAHYVPPPHGDEARTFHADGSGRPQDLFAVATEALLYRTLADTPRMDTDRDRLCAWLEVGLGGWAAFHLRGMNGWAAAGEPAGLDIDALQTLGGGFTLTNLVHTPAYEGYHLQDDVATQVRWSASRMLVAWLMDPGAQPVRTPQVLRFAREAMAAGKGDSSSVLDECLGAPVESLDAPWRQWLLTRARGANR